jgi:ubiquinone/menaquinone biosynthesis C-methylase UbiE
MAKHVCPWWVGYLLVSPVRRWLQNPEKILGPYIREGMVVLDVGPAMGFFTIPAAAMVGETGRVIALDVQERMLRALERRAKKAGMDRRIFTHLCAEDQLGLSDPIDLCLAFNVLHEVPDARGLFAQIHAILKPAGKVLLVEPRHHVSETEFRETVNQGLAEGFKVVEEPQIRGGRAVVLEPEIRMSQAAAIESS